MPKRKKKKKVKEPRNILAIQAHFRKAGSLKDRRKKREEDKGIKEQILAEEYGE